MYAVARTVSWFLDGYIIQSGIDTRLADHVETTAQHRLNEDPSHVPAIHQYLEGFTCK
jgi:hypothetical protein